MSTVVFQPEKLLLNFQEAATLLGIGRSTLSNYALKIPARIKSVKIGGRRCFRREWIDEFIDAECERQQRHRYGR